LPFEQGAVDDRETIEERRIILDQVLESLLKEGRHFRGDVLIMLIRRR